MRLVRSHLNLSAISLLLAISLLAGLCGCRANVQAHYNTATDAQVDGAFNRGTLPTILFPDTTDIDELHDFGVEHTGATFHFTQPFLDRLNDRCQLYSADDRIDSPFSSWPDFINHHQTAGQLLRESGYTALHCGTATVLINSSGSGLLWH